MTIVCVMLSRGLGGLEQSLIDYCQALDGQGHRVVAVIHPAWPGRPELIASGIPYRLCTSFSEWDPVAVIRLRRLLRSLGPAAVMTIGRRASNLVRRTCRQLPGLPQIAKTPNYSLRHLIGLDHVLATTEDIRQALVAAGHPAEAISVVPNMIRVPDDARLWQPTQGRVPVIGGLGRFVEKKGFADLIDALGILARRGHAFRATIGGSGAEEETLRRRVEELGLAEKVAFPGWITDKRPFFEALDLFCVPSRHEPFGIVVLEGFAFGRPCVVTDAEGPREIVTDGVDGLIAARGDPEALAEAIGRMLDDPELARRLAAGGLATARARFDQSVVAGRISTVLYRIAGGRST